MSELKSVLAIRSPVLVIGMWLSLGAQISVNLLASTTPEIRIWSDSTGSFSVEAKMISAKPDSVQLEKRDGTTLVIPLNRLSRSDQAYVQKIAREQKEKARLEAPVREDVHKRFGSRPKGFFLSSLEEGTGRKPVSVTIQVSHGADAVVEDLVRFLIQAKSEKRDYQILGWFPDTPEGKERSMAHREKLQRFMEARLADSSFSREPCHSDLAPQSGQSIKQKIEEGTCIKYSPFE